MAPDTDTSLSVGESAATGSAVPVLTSNAAVDSYDKTVDDDEREERREDAEDQFEESKDAHEDAQDEKIEDEEANDPNNFSDDGIDQAQGLSDQEDIKCEVMSDCPLHPFNICLDGKC